MSHPMLTPRRGRRAQACPAVLALLAFAVPAAAQPRASLTGNVRDVSDSAVFGAAVTARILAGFARGKVERLRAQIFEQQYKPALLRFLQQCTPALAQRFANP